MKFEELSSVWNSSDMELEKTVQINKELIKEISFSKIRSRLYEIKWTSYFEIIIGVIWFNFLVGFIIEHFSAWQFSVPAGALLLIAAFSIALEGSKLYLYYTLDSQSAVADAQKKLSKLKQLEVMDTYSLLVIIPLFAVPFLVVVAKAFLHIDLYDILSGWLIQIFISSIVIAGILVFILIRYPNRRLIESIEFLKELKEKEND